MVGDASVFGSAVSVELGWLLHESVYVSRSWAISFAERCGCLRGHVDVGVLVTWHSISWIRLSTFTE